MVGRAQVGLPQPSLKKTERAALQEDRFEHPDGLR
ncbi:MAG: hypothetical protein RL042_1426 [Nitrospirota bacterium]|jgi:hypothetical protein